jgi:hypothetical protein
MHFEVQDLRRLRTLVGAASVWWVEAEVDVKVEGIGIGDWATVTIAGLRERRREGK